MKTKIQIKQKIERLKKLKQHKYGFAGIGLIIRIQTLEWVLKDE